MTEIEERLDGVVNQQQAHMLAKCSFSLLRQAIGCGAIPFAKISNRIFMLRSDVEKWDEARKSRLLDGRTPQVSLMLLNALPKVDLSFLHPKQRDIMQRRFGLNGYPVHTLEQIGVAHGFSRERARQLLKGARDALMLRLIEVQLQSEEEVP